jgi:ribonuclease HI
MREIVVYTYGTSIGNPGPAAIGFRVVDDTDTEISSGSEPIGNAAADYAAYFAVVRALQTAREALGEKTKMAEITVFTSHELVAEQLNDEAVITHPGLVPQFIEIHNLCVTDFSHAKFLYTSESQNTEAVKLVQQLLDV